MHSYCYLDISWQQYSRHLSYPSWCNIPWPSFNVCATVYSICAELLFQKYSANHAHQKLHKHQILNTHQIINIHQIVNIHQISDKHQILSMLHVLNIQKYEFSLDLLDVIFQGQFSPKSFGVPFGINCDHHMISYNMISAYLIPYHTACYDIMSYDITYDRFYILIIWYDIRPYEILRHHIIAYDLYRAISCDMKLTCII